MYSYFSHPNNVCMSYFTHCKFALLLSSKLFIGSMKSFIHALFPSLFITFTSDLVNEISQDLKNAGCRENNVDYIESNQINENKEKKL